jgi:sulfatase maturation enzyme AslB (radical SAM superfamily)
MNKTLCAYPWRSAAIRPNGLTIPCCRYPHIDEVESVVDNLMVRNTPHWVSIRDSMLKGKVVEGCHSCYQDEANGLTSMRQYSLSKFVPIKNEIGPVEQLEVSFSNLCNLACVHCSSFFSSKWYAEDVKSGRVKKSGVLENSFSFDLWDMSHITELKIIGGEPFMEQPQFINLLQNLDISKVSIQICTNGTILPNEDLKKLIEQCKNVYLCVSLDGLESTNDWYRWPSKFDKVVAGMLQYEEWWDNLNNVHFIVHHVINAINVVELKKFVDYMQDVFPLWKVEWDWIRWPDWQQLSVLPTSLKKELVTQFEKELQYSNKKIPNPYKITIERMNEKTDLNFDVLEHNVASISQERNLDYQKMIPLITQHFKNV